MLAQAIDEAVDFARLDPADYAAEWKWDGIRVQAVIEGEAKRLYTRTGDDISVSFEDVLNVLDFEGVVDGELLVIRAGKVAGFADLQQRLNRKSVDTKTMVRYPAAIRAYDLLADRAKACSAGVHEAEQRALQAAEKGRRLRQEASAAVDIATRSADALGRAMAQRGTCSEAVQTVRADLAR